MAKVAVTNTIAVTPLPPTSPNPNKPDSMTVQSVIAVTPLPQQSRFEVTNTGSVKTLARRRVMNGPRVTFRYKYGYRYGYGHRYGHRYGYVYMLGLGYGYGLGAPGEPP